MTVTATRADGMAIQYHCRRVKWRQRFLCLFDQQPEYGDVDPKLMAVLNAKEFARIDIDATPTITTAAPA